MCRVCAHANAVHEPCWLPKSQHVAAQHACLLSCMPPATLLQRPGMWQVCLAFRSEGGVRVVIMCQRPKLAMEDLFNQAIPVNVRYGTSFVFRQVCPPNLLLSLIARCCMRWVRRKHGLSGWSPARGH